MKGRPPTPRRTGALQHGPQRDRLIDGDVVAEVDEVDDGGGDGGEDAVLLRELEDVAVEVVDLGHALAADVDAVLAGL